MRVCVCMCVCMCAPVVGSLSGKGKSGAAQEGFGSCFFAWRPEHCQDHAVAPNKNIRWRDLGKNSTNMTRFYLGPNSADDIFAEQRIYFGYIFALHVYWVGNADRHSQVAVFTIYYQTRELFALCETVM
jgi:hypothetical protein